MRVKTSNRITTCAAFNGLLLSGAKYATHRGW